MDIEQSPLKRSRGRPRQFDEEEVLAAAGDLFWTNGYSATSLDDLAGVMGMNRPSIYRAFGDKQTLYRRALAQFGEGLRQAMQHTLFARSDVRAALTAFYREALKVYLSGDQPRGCMVMSTAATAATAHPEIQKDLLSVVRVIDQKLEERLAQAINADQLPPEFDAGSRAAVAQSILHSLSLRARAGEGKTRLNRLIHTGVEVVLS
jgi:AcrR family transcriptional regulator